MKTQGIQITRFTYEEPHLLNLRIAASNGRVNGELEYYCNADDLKDIGNQLIRFLGKEHEEIVYELGSEKTEDRFAFFFSLRVVSLDSVGHCAVCLRMNNNRQPPETEACEFCIPADVADVNRLGRLLVAFGKLEHKALDWSVKDGKLFKDIG